MKRILPRNPTNWTTGGDPVRECPPACSGYHKKSFRVRIIVALWRDPPVPGVNSPQKGLVMRKAFELHDVFMKQNPTKCEQTNLLDELNKSSAYVRNVDGFWVKKKNTLRMNWEFNRWSCPRIVFALPPTDGVAPLWSFLHNFTRYRWCVIKMAVGTQLSLNQIWVNHGWCTSRVAVGIYIFCVLIALLNRSGKSTVPNTTRAINSCRISWLRI